MLYHVNRHPLTPFLSVVRCSPHFSRFNFDDFFRCSSSSSSSSSFVVDVVAAMTPPLLTS